VNQAVASPDPVWGDVYLTPAFRINTPPTFKFVASGQSIKADWAGLVKGFVGLYQINVRLPDTLADRTQGCPGGNLNVRFLFGTGVPQEDLNSAESVDICASRQHSAEGPRVLAGDEVAARKRTRAIQPGRGVIYCAGSLSIRRAATSDKASASRATRSRPA